MRSERVHFEMPAFKSGVDLLAYAKTGEYHPKQIV